MPSTLRFTPEQIAAFEAAGYTVATDGCGELTLRFNGALHDGPNGELARVYRSIKGDDVTYFHYQHGTLHDGPNHEPALIRREVASGLDLSVQRYHFGQHHDGPNGEPAYIWRDEDSGVVVTEGHYHLGASHDGVNGEAAQLQRDPLTGVVYREARFQYGRLRDGPNGEPARLYRDRETGAVTEAHRAIDGELQPFTKPEIAALNLGGLRARRMDEQIHELRQRAALLSILIADDVAERWAKSPGESAVTSSATYSPNFVFVPRHSPAPRDYGPFGRVAGYRVARGSVRSGDAHASTGETQRRGVDDGPSAEFIVTPHGVLCAATRRGDDGDLAMHPIRTARDIPQAVEITPDPRNRPADDAPQPLAAKIRALSAALDQHIETVGPRQTLGTYSAAERALRDLRADLRLQWADAPPDACPHAGQSYSTVVVDATGADLEPIRYLRLLAGEPTPRTSAAERRALGTPRESYVVITDRQTLAVEDMYMSGVGPWHKRESRLRPLRRVSDIPWLDDPHRYAEPEDATYELALVRRVALVRDAAARARAAVPMAPPQPVGRATPIVRRPRFV